MNIAKLALFPLLLAGPLHAEGLYYVGTEILESMPIKWSVGANVIYDDNVSPGGINDGQDSTAANLSLSVAFVNVTPQTTWDVYARLGMVYYFDASETMDDVNSQSRLGVNLTHRFSERLRFSSSNFISYELEPDYSYGYANTRSVDEYFFWQTDNSIGFRWSERFATYTGVSVSGLAYSEAENNDRLTWMIYNSGRYQLSPRTVLTAEYRHGFTTGDGLASDSTNQYVLVGLEHRFSPNTIAILRTGAQFRDVDDGGSLTSPYLEFALSSQVNHGLRVKAFVRYGLESYDTVQTLLEGPDNNIPYQVEYDARPTLRIGVDARYAISPLLTVFGGIDYVPSSYENGRRIGAVGPVPDSDEDIINLTLGISVLLSNNMSANFSYVYTDSSSDIPGREYDRNRLSIGVNYQF